MPIVGFVGYNHVMRTTTGDRRRITAGLLLIGMLATITYCPGAPAMACRMDAPAVASATSDCGSCDAERGGTATATLKAGSCCRFTTPEEVTTLPAWTQTSQRSIAGVELQALPPVLASSPAFNMNAAGAAPAAGISEPPAPQSLSTHLRL